MLLCILLLFSCLKENRSGCPRQIRVYFIAPAFIDPAGVDRMHLYVFDRDGYFVTKFRDDNIAGFSPDYYIDCSGLRPGNYRLIAWGGKDERYYSTSPASLVAGKTTFDEALLMLDHPQNIVTKSPSHIFHSDIAATVVAGNSFQRFDMPLSQLSNTINIYTVGLAADADDYTFNIVDNNCSYGFDRLPVSPPHAGFTYSAPCARDSEMQLRSTLNVLMLSADRRTPQLGIYNEIAGKPLYPAGNDTRASTATITQSGDLIGLILAANPHNDFETTHRYDIVLDFSTGLGVAVSVNGWQVRDQNNELAE